MRDDTEFRRAVIGVLLGLAYGALIGLLARRDKASRRTLWAGGSKT